MNGKVGALGLVLVALVAVCVGPLPAAQAGKLDIGASPAVLEGSQDSLKTTQLTFNLGGATIICETGSFEGTTQATTLEDATVTPTYGAKEDCTVILETKVRMNGCKYTLTGAGQAANTFLVDIVGCTAGKQMKIEVPVYGCVYSIPEQSGISHVVAKTGLDIGGVPDITLEMTLTGISYKRESGAGICTGPAEGANGSLQGSTFVKAYKDAGSQQVNKHGHIYSELLTGGQVSLSAT